MKRRGFTLIELMVVIAIIIILAAIAIPNYLKMTERAKKSRISSDMATLATGLETFNTDWGSYPGSTTAIAVSEPGNVLYGEMTGTTGAVSNVSANTNSAGEKGGPLQIYLKEGTLTSIVDPFGAGSGTADNKIYYLTDADPGLHWMLFAYSSGTADGGQYLYRTDGSSTVVEMPRSAPAISIAGVPTY